jgi:hypothetical protein
MGAVLEGRRDAGKESQVHDRAHVGNGGEWRGKAGQKHHVISNYHFLSIRSTSEGPLVQMVQATDNGVPQTSGQTQLC